uniref:Uncharacterized protein n=1 Tax=Daphnia galeata TaxID=27404 RepID=A0A8J2RS79_9CRUS|nr:unnamed protein product [Daphnia galeata]
MPKPQKKKKEVSSRQKDIGQSTPIWSKVHMCEWPSHHSSFVIRSQHHTSLEPDEESLGDQRVFDVLCDEVVDTWLSDDERHDLFHSQLPTMVDYALQLKTLKPLRGLHFSLQQQISG